MKFILLALCLVSFSCCAQDKKPASPYNKEAIKLNDQSVKILLGPGDSKEKLISANLLLDSAIKIDRHYLIAHGNLVQNLLSLKDYQKALSRIDSALIIKPDFNEMIAAKGMILTKLGDTVNAKAAFIQLIAVYKDKYAADPNISNLRNFMLSDYLLNGREHALHLLNEERHKFKDSPEQNKAIDQLTNYLNKVSFEMLFGSD